MNSLIKMHLLGFLKPLLNVPIKDQNDVTTSEEFASLDVVSTTLLGMGNDVSQGVDEQGNQLIYLPYKTECSLHYFGCDAVSMLAELASQLRRTSVLEQLQHIYIGIGQLGKIEAKEDKVLEGESLSHAVFNFSIHYTEKLNDNVGVIETVNAAHNGGKTTIHLTR